MSEQDPKYSHFAESVTRGRNIPEKNTNHGEASAAGQMDFFPNAEERYCDEGAWEAESKAEIEQAMSYSRASERRSIARHHRSEGERDYGKSGKGENGDE
jgi:hypothetical protein